MEQLAIMNFLSDLQKNNNREWFINHKPTYQKALLDFEAILSRIISLVGIFDKEIVGLNPKACIFRIYRDVRFSNDKSPYKTHFGAFIAPGGRKNSEGGYYIHIAPGESMKDAKIYEGYYTLNSRDLQFVEIFPNLITRKKHHGGKFHLSDYRWRGDTKYCVV